MIENYAAQASIDQMHIDNIHDQLAFFDNKEQVR